MFLYKPSGRLGYPSGREKQQQQAENAAVWIQNKGFSQLKQKQVFKGKIVHQNIHKHLEWVERNPTSRSSTPTSFKSNPSSSYPKPTDLQTQERDSWV